VAAAFESMAVPSGASVGGAVRSGARTDAEELRGEADRALYEAKRQGGATVRFRVPANAIA
jgi:GGDEF domain-containing protein